MRCRGTREIAYNCTQPMGNLHKVFAAPKVSKPNIFPFDLVRQHGITRSAGELCPAILVGNGHVSAGVRQHLWLIGMLAMVQSHMLAFPSRGPSVRQDKSQFFSVLTCKFVQGFLRATIDRKVSKIDQPTFPRNKFDQSVIFVAAPKPARNCADRSGYEVGEANPRKKLTDDINLNAFKYFSCIVWATCQAVSSMTVALESAKRFMNSHLGYLLLASTFCPAPTEQKARG